MSWSRIDLQRAFALSVVGLLCGSAVALADPPRVEVDVTNSPTQLNGRPDIAVNPLNPDNLVMTANIFSSVVLPFSPCFVAYSMDRGVTWTQATWPIGDSPNCGEPEVAVDAAGTFYLDSNQLGCPPGVTPPPGYPFPPGYCDIEVNRTAVSHSTDGGATWSPPVKTPLHVAANARLEVDLETGALYALGSTKFLWPGGISVSTDQGQTWSTPIDAVPNSPPCTPPPIPGFGCGIDPYIAVYDGILATVAEVPPGVTFNVSVDGAPFTTLPVTDSNGTPVPSGGATGVLFGFPEPLLAADPTYPGRFAVAIPRGNPNAFQIYITSDAGQTWDGPTVIPAPRAFHPAMRYGDQGWLGLMWRAGTDPAGGVDAMAVVSVNRGKSFSPPVQINAVTQPISNSGQPPGDTGTSGIDLNAGNVFVVWSDGRGGAPPATDAIFGRLSVSRFTSGH